ncbi:MAG: hypothetical protein AAFY71_03125 [Bacteroidota bacterium]
MKKFFLNSLNRRYNPLNWLIVLCMICFLTACDQQGDQGDSVVIARYGNRTLKADELNYYLPSYTNLEDSARFADQVIKKWIRQQVVEEEALRQIPTINDEIEPKLNDYRQALVEQRFAKLLVDQNPEKFEVSPQEVLNYYQKFPEKFISKANFYQFFFIKTTQESQWWIINSLKEGGKSEFDKVLEWSSENAQVYKLDSAYRTEGELMDVSLGFYFGNIRKSTPGQVYYYQQQEGDVISFCFFKLLTVVKEGDPMPFEMVEEEIKLIIQNQLKQTLIDQTISRMVQEAKATQKFRVVNKEES